MSGTCTKSESCCGGGTDSPQSRSSPCCRSDRPRCRPEPLGCPSSHAPAGGALRGPPGSTPLPTCEEGAARRMGRHVENTVVSGIVNYVGTNTFKNTVVNGK